MLSGETSGDGGYCWLPSTEITWAADHWRCSTPVDMPDAAGGDALEDVQTARFNHAYDSKIGIGISWRAALVGAA